MSSPILAARALSAGYGAMPVVRNIDLEVRPGEVVALLGRNGAGKSTTLLALSGELRPLAGDVILDGAPARGGLPERAQAGLAFIPETRSVFKELTVAENLRLGRGPATRALELFPELRDHVNRRADLLSGGQQQILALARALAAEPRVLLADELSLGLAPLIVRRVLDAVRSAAERGIGVLLVEQHVRQALAIADRAYLLDRGEVALEGSAAEMITHLDEIERAYLEGVDAQPVGAEQ
jgi:branched-chain amino acid transport system ATP-binding protein